MPGPQTLSVRSRFHTRYSSMCDSDNNLLIPVDSDKKRKSVVFFWLRLCHEPGPQQPLRCKCFPFRYINCCKKAFTSLYNSQASMHNHAITPVTPGDSHKKEISLNLFMVHLPHQPGPQSDPPYSKLRCERHGTFSATTVYLTLSLDTYTNSRYRRYIYVYVIIYLSIYLSLCITVVFRFMART
jgi:hypothetical protein